MKTKPAVHQFLGTCSYGDAIGNMALYYQKQLRKSGFASEIFAGRIHPLLSGKVYLASESYERLKPEDIIINHMSIGSDVSRIVYYLPNRLVLYYHNITPAEFFKGFHDVLMRQCAAGREELKAFAAKTELAVADSDFNRRELDKLGFKRTATVPVPLDFSSIKNSGSDIILKLYDDSLTNLLFVGRVIPNKKIEDVIRFFALYKNEYNADSRLFVVGSYIGFEQYLHWLRRLARRLGVQKSVIFAGHISDDDLAAYYNISDAFLMMSEHEGFCVPVLEAFAQDLPVIAFDGGAVGETMRGGGILLSEKKLGIASELLNRVISDRPYKDSVLKSQRDAIERYKREAMEFCLLKVLKDRQII